MEHHIAVALINPRLARALPRAKESPKPTRLMPACCASPRSSCSPPSCAIGAEREQLAALLDRRAQLSEQMTKEKPLGQVSIHASIRKMLRLLERELARSKRKSMPWSFGMLSSS